MPSTACALVFLATLHQAPHVMVENYKLPKVRRLRQARSILCAGGNLSTYQGKDGKLDFDAMHSFAV